MHVWRSIGLLFLLPALAVPVAAHADTFTFTPDGGSAITFSIADGSAPTEYALGAYAVYELSDDSAVAFVHQTSFAEDLEILVEDSSDTGVFVDVLDGGALYSGPESSPTFLLGTYELTADASSDEYVGGTLTITPDVAATPEPSSLALLGTGLVGALGVARRRFA